MMKKSLIITTALTLLLILVSAALAGAAERTFSTVWMIGADNGSSYDFSAKPSGEWFKEFPGRFADGFNLDAARKPAKEVFPGLQPGPSCGCGPSRTYPVNIKFSLDTVKPGGYLLTVGFAGVSPGTDAKMTIGANGHKQNQTAMRGANSIILENTIKGDPRTIAFFIPADQMKAGDNLLTITLTEGQWVVYDYIKLESVA